MGDILKEAIADAKAVRETALANAKMALEEAFTPQLKSMLSAKLREDDDEFEGEEEAGEEEVAEDEEVEDEEVEDEEVEDEEEVAFEEDDEFGDEEAEAEVEEEGIIEIDGVKYAPVVAEEEGEEEVEDEDEEEVAEEELDLEAIIKELESELSEQDEEEAVEEEAVTEDTEDTEEVDEEIEIDETLFTEEDDEDEEEVEETVNPLQSELDEYKEAVLFLKDKLHEVNILNAKLLFTNKLFKEFSLDNGQKLKVVETFDRAQTTREIKLVYSTLAEQFGDNGSITKKHNIKESASKPVSSTKPSEESKKVITEEQQVANRFKKLAGIL
tara:strand:+ start:870 stop:1853 length:984 start_codon:yes stop_codon:yes gene_type:complete